MEVGTKIEVFDERRQITRVGVVTEVYKEFVRARFDFPIRNRTFYESFNLPRLEGDYWRCK